MLKLSIIASLFLSSAALACPNLAGDYACDTSFEASITQAEVNGVTTYSTNITGEQMDLIADGMTRTLGDGSTLKVGCMEEAVNVTIKRLLYDDDGSVVGSDTMDAKGYSQDGNLVISGTSTITIGNQSNQASFQNFCQKL